MILLIIIFSFFSVTRNRSISSWTNRCWRNESEPRLFEYYSIRSRKNRNAYDCQSLSHDTCTTRSSWLFKYNGNQSMGWYRNAPFPPAVCTDECTWNVLMWLVSFSRPQYTSPVAHSRLPRSVRTPLPTEWRRMCNRGYGFISVLVFVEHVWRYGFVVDQSLFVQNVITE